MEHTLQTAGEILSRLEVPKVNVIDVGCHTGRVTADIVSLLRGKEVFSVGVDPIFHAPLYQFSRRFQVAIRDCEPCEETFYQYSDPMCSSLLKMTDNITHDPAERDTKWYAEQYCEVLQATKTVSVWPMSKVIEEAGLVGQVIHFLKVDAQGSDLDVFKSLHEHQKNCLVIQLEAVTSEKSEIVLYEGQELLETQKEVLVTAGFSVVEFFEHGVSPEADVLYVNDGLRSALGC